MPFTLTQTIITFIGCILFVEIVWVSYHGILSKILARNITPFTRKKDSHAPSILIIGDSTVIGVGTKSPSNTVVGRIASMYQDYTIIADGVLGGKTSDIRKLFEKYKEQKFSTILIMCGGMDVIKFTTTNKYREDLNQLLRNAKNKTGHVVYVSAPNVGNTPIFHFPLSFFYSLHAKKLNKIAEEVASKNKVIQISLFRSKEEDLFENRPLFAKDKSHPNDEGYAIWFNEIIKKIDL